jgi:6,7-dimethyl-8-ribityllumazine synthase
VARFNSFITDRLLAGAEDALRRSGAKAEDVEIVKVPGSWELPLVAKTLAAAKRHDAIIALGAVIRGETPHFDHVANQASSGLASVQLETGVPIAFGVLTTNTVEQAIDRAGGKSGNKGYDAAITAIEMADVIRKLRK